MYFSANPGGHFHIWRQMFPDGPLQQVTSGTTEEEGIAMSADGESLLTSVGTTDYTIWIHDASGDHQLSLEGNAYGTALSPDKSKLYYVLRQGDRGGDSGLWVRDLASGASELVASGSAIQHSGGMQEYGLSRDGKTVALAVNDDVGAAHIWLAPADHRSSPRELVSPSSQDSPWFLPNGDLVVRSIEGSQNFLYRTHPDGTGRQKITEDPILDLHSVSLDGRWAMVLIKNSDPDYTAAQALYPIEGGPAILLCRFACSADWDATGRFFYLSFRTLHDDKSYMLPVNPARGIPDLPVGGFTTIAELKADKRVIVVPQDIDSAVGPNYYSYTRSNTRRNIYRIPLPD